MAKRNWNDHLSDFSLEDSGDYNYRGAFYATVDATVNLAVDVAKDATVDTGQTLTVASQRKSREVSLMKMFVISLFILFAAVFGGVFPATGATDTWYVILPFGLTIAVSGVLAYHVLRLTMAFYTKEASNTSGLRSVNAEAHDAGNQVSDQASNTSGLRPVNAEAHDAGNQASDQASSTSGLRSVNAEAHDAGNQASDQASSTSGLRPVNAEAHDAGNQVSDQASSIASGEQIGAETNAVDIQASSISSGEQISAENNAVDIQANFDKNGIGLVREYIFLKTWPRLTPMTKAVMVLSIITVITEALHLLIKGRGDHFGGAVLLLVCMLITAGLSTVLLRCYDRLKWQRLSKNSGL